MANSKYEYVKSFEVEHKLMPSTWIVVRIVSCHFHQLTEVNEFDKPNDEQALNLMNACVAAMLEEFPDIVFSYGFSDEYSFVFKDISQFYQRRESKILSIIVSFFTSIYVMKWKEFFPQKDLPVVPSFDGLIICYPTTKTIRDYLGERQEKCHINNQYNTCFWMLVKSGKTKNEAEDFLKGTQPQEKNELLFQQFNINYNTLPAIFRKGSCVFNDKVEEIVKYNEAGDPVKRLRKKVIIDYCDISREKFWKDHPSILKEVGEQNISFSREGNWVNMANRKYEYLKSFEVEHKLMPSTWIVLRIDGRHFHKFSEEHEFDKPNDEQALNLMNACAVAMLEEFPDIVFSYGVSDEYSFVFDKNSQLYQRRESKIVSITVSVFSSFYVMKWKEFFPQKDLRSVPSFDARTICYPSTKIIRDYLAWRQVDCHINNQYNTCFWMLVKSGKAKREAYDFLKGTQTPEKNELLFQQFNINYDRLPTIFQKGSCVYRDKVDEIVKYNEGGEGVKNKMIVEHCDIIEDAFWRDHPSILKRVTSNLC